MGRRSAADAARGPTRFDQHDGPRRAFTLDALAEGYFEQSTGARVAFVTDTRWSEALKPELTKLAKGAWRLYCDSFYARKEAKNAAQYRHMMAHQSAQLAKLAKLDQLVLMHFATRYAGKYEALVDEAHDAFPNTTAEI